MTPNSKLHDQSHEYIAHLVAGIKGSTSEVARTIGISPRMLRHHMQSVDKGGRPAPYTVQFALEALFLAERDK